LSDDFQKTSAAVVAIINLILFELPSDRPPYYQASTAMIGKMYSNTMMVALNSRINISKWESGSTDYSTESNSEIPRRLPIASHGDISTVTHEQLEWTTASPEAHRLPVSMSRSIQFSSR
jgi:hypothetical protein